MTELLIVIVVLLACLVLHQSIDSRTLVGWLVRSIGRVFFVSVLCIGPLLLTAWSFEQLTGIAFFYDLFTSSWAGLLLAVACIYLIILLKTQQLADQDDLPPRSVK